ncbi:Glycoside hydrolase, family 3-like protein [Trichormus variabilis ATCC 29413]|uniref:Glycoside hydrolase, family 3-like protein n=3 Tax=Nostocaceae TaxID=1162 RepID=Q3M3J2_TRIV2|nr:MULTISPECIES: beta-N-acetylhexosaminidase [Nostocaceae]ACY66645.1 glycoside hydrolase family 3-like protein [Anabaena sphaerica RPAN12]ABA24444.1 Glycoside hydrolase, family 3-like protein [Trichormus variabilis ATCC 29413]MBC1214351.1 beta-N-acetylhexosaminidase [Trichormus variabilis ARAD]MBC1256841.1 beta-N-acetylhexosaminidase [Trichormus variabilis V5]MBC1267272.1 beta-N-acetylhexosaminidase [Trichormus variabilis FSR]
MPALQRLERFGNHLILGISGTSLSDEDKRALGELKPIGVIFFAKNFVDGVPYEVWLETFQELHSQIQEYAERDSMFFTLDHEGGRVVRTPLPITRFPQALLLRSHAREVAKATAIELKSLGINLSWSPVADIYSHPQNPIIGSRAFGNTPETAATGAREYYLGLTEAGIVGCAKHFPGHGDTSKDSHVELPILNLTPEELRRRELIPFKALIEEGIPLIMTAHILFPKIDPDLPATLSRPILKTILREELGFQGVVVSDDLDMKAVSDMFMERGTVARAFNAGCDLFIVSRNIHASSIERTYKIAENFADALTDGSLAESVVDSAKERIERLLAVTPEYSVQMLDKDTLVHHGELAIACCF